MKSKIISLILSVVILFSTGCKKFLDVNQNPNVAQDVPVEMLLPSAQIFTGSALGVDLGINGSLWAQYWTQSPSANQYNRYDQYQPGASDYDRVWGLLYNSSLEDLDRLEKKAIATNKKDYLAIARILKAYNFQVVTDAWGDIPFTQALKGLNESGGITSPKYDPQQLIYDSLISMLTAATSIIEGLATSHVGGDLIYNGDMEMWYRFANTLQLRMLLRISQKDQAKASAGIADLYNRTGGGFFLEEGQTAKIDYSSEAGNQNPLYSEMQGLNATQNLVGSKTVIDSMISNNDERIGVLFAGTLVGIPQGAANTLPATTPAARPGPITGGFAADDNSALAPVIFLSDYESYFLQAEAVARGFAPGGPAVAKDFFESGIYASFNMFKDDIDSWGIILRDSFAGAPITTTTTFYLTAEYAAYRYINGDTLTGFVSGDPVVQLPASNWGQFPSAGTQADQVRYIITQKWFSMAGLQGFESWTEWRRTGYPTFFTLSISSGIGNSFPVRFLYPNTELTRNANFPGQITVTDKVWWDVN
jgi:hypothetical protein